MSTSLLYHAFGIRGYSYTRTAFVGGTIHFAIDRGKNRCVARLAARRQYTHVVEPRERFEPSPSDANPWSFTSRFRASIASPAV